MKLGNKKNVKKELPKIEEKVVTLPKKKEDTVWGISNNISSSKLKGLDFSKDKNVDNNVIAEKKYLEIEGKGEEFKGKFLDDNEEVDLSDSEDEEDTKKPKKKGLFSIFSNSIKNITGNKVK